MEESEPSEITQTEVLPFPVNITESNGDCNVVQEDGVITTVGKNIDLLDNNELDLDTSVSTSNEQESASLEGYTNNVSFSPDIMGFKLFEQNIWEEERDIIVNTISMKYADISSIFQERLNALLIFYKNDEAVTGEFKWEELNKRYFKDLNILTVPTPLIECLNHYLPIYENLYVILASNYICNILAVKAWNEGHWLSHYNGYEINFINKENVFRNTLKEHVTESDKKLLGYCFVMKNNFIMFCLQSSYQELTRCEKKITVIYKIFKELLNDDKHFLSKNGEVNDSIKINAMRKVNLYFHLCQKRALDGANHKCQAIIIQFLKLTKNPQALHIPRYGRTGFNIRVCNNKPTMSNSNLVIKQQTNIPTFTGFINGVHLPEHKIAAEMNLARLVSNTPPVFFEGDKPHFFEHVESWTPTTTSSNTVGGNRSKIDLYDPFTINDVISLAAPLAPKSDSSIPSKVSLIEPQSKLDAENLIITTADETSFTKKRNTDNNVDQLLNSDNCEQSSGSAASSLAENENISCCTSSVVVVRSLPSIPAVNPIELITPQLVQVCLKQKLEFPKGSLTLKRCVAGATCTHRMKCRFGHTRPEIDIFILNYEMEDNQSTDDNILKVKLKNDSKQLAAISTKTPSDVSEPNVAVKNRKVNNKVKQNSVNPRPPKSPYPKSVGIKPDDTTNISGEFIENLCTTLVKTLRDTTMGNPSVSSSKYHTMDNKRQRSLSPPPHTLYKRQRSRSPSPPTQYNRQRSLLSTPPNHYNRQRPPSPPTHSIRMDGALRHPEKHTHSRDNLFTTPIVLQNHTHSRENLFTTSNAPHNIRQYKGSNSSTQVMYRVYKGQSTNISCRNVTTLFVLPLLDTASPAEWPTQNCGDAERKPSTESSKRCRPRKETLSLSLRSCKHPADYIKNKGVNNLAKASISDEEMLVLTLGLKFVLPDRSCLNYDDELIDSIENFCRNIRIKKKFLLNCDKNSVPLNNKDILHQKVKNINSSFEPPPAGLFLEHYIKRLKYKIQKLMKTNNDFDKNVDFGISDRMKATALKVFSRKDIIIKNADKNLGVTIMDRSFYFEEALSQRQLGNLSTYKPIQNLPESRTLIEALTSILIKYNQYVCCYGKTTQFTKDLLINLAGTKITPSQMYFLPKIHKIPVALRPICASTKSSTYNASKYLDIILQPIMKNISSFIRNSGELVCKLEAMVFPSYCQLLEADVENLYPSINIEDGLNSLRLALVRHMWAITEIEFVVVLARWVLTNNYIQFGDRYYLQLMGTAMGTPFAVTFACIHLAIIEAETIDVIKLQGFSLPLLYHRFIDDIIAVFPSAEDGKAFMTVFNTRRVSIHCPNYKISAKSVTFLDITILKDVRFNTCGLLDVKLYQKPINKFLFLPPNSYHPKHCTNGWISGYIKRIRLNCSNDTDFVKFKSEFFTHLRNRGHGTSIIDLFQVNYNRPELLNEAQIAICNKAVTGYPIASPVTLVLQHNPRTVVIKNRIKILLKPSSFTKNDSDCKSIFGSNLSPCCAWTNGTSLMSLLTRTKLAPVDIPFAYKVKRDQDVQPSDH